MGEVWWVADNITLNFFMELNSTDCTICVFDGEIRLLKGCDVNN